MIRAIGVVAVFALALTAVIVTATATKKASSTSTSETALMFGVITPECLDIFLNKHDFLNVPCVKFVISKTLGYAIITASFILKLPQILKILNAKSVAGLTPAGFYMEVVLFLSGSVYNVLRGYPISTWGENLVILIQNIILVLLMWTFNVPVISIATRLFYVLVFIALTAGMFLMPPEIQWILPSAAIPITVSARIPQVVSNFRQGHTGQLALITLVLNFGGSVARLFTTLQETGDVMQLVGFTVSLFLNGTLVFQVLYYWNATKKALAQQTKKKTS